ncbi:MAG TPA: hypothetical protein VFG73_10770 [Rhodanobacteraceae bacterium]|nr:hypothetical protein [Rhodanobacteraceae bacterium]
MKIRQAPEQLIIDNSLCMPVAAGAILCLGGIGIVIMGYLNRLWWLPLLGLALLVIGALVACLSKATHIVLAKSGDSSIASRRLFSASSSHSFALTDVLSVQLRSSTTQRLRNNSADGSQRYETEVTSSVFLHTRDAQQIALGSHTRTMSIGGMIGALVRSMPLKKEAERIAAFIGVPMEVYEGTSFGSAQTT